MPDTDFNPAEASTWLARGRRPAHAEALAKAWRDFPDLPPSAPVADRQARSRERVIATRPVFEEMRLEAEAERHATNFAFTENEVREGKANERDVAILNGRDRHGYDWDVANRYADGWYAAHVGWPHHYPDGIPCNAPLEIRREAYDQGFTDGGGDRTDLFDAARRANLALHRQSNRPAAMVPAAPARPLPSSWPKPSDEARPARWSRRLAILSDADLADGDPARAKWDFLRIVRDRHGAEAATILILTDGGFAYAADYAPSASQGRRRQLPGDVLRQQLVQALAGREIDDVLVALQDEDLRLLDGIASALPLCRTMERTRNTKLQQRTHLRTWLDRGYGETENMAAGHIRWGKLIQGLVGKLGEFTVRHVGPAPVRGQLIRVEVGDGQLATGYADANGTPIAAEIIVSRKAKLRSEMAATLRRFGTATTIMAATARHAA